MCAYICMYVLYTDAYTLYSVESYISQTKATFSWMDGWMAGSYVDRPGVFVEQHH